MKLLEKIKLETIIMDPNFSKKEKLDYLLDMYASNETNDWDFKRDGYEYKMRYVTVTPELATMLVTYFNDVNRPVSDTNVLNLSKEMLNDKWAVNGETITFNKNGDLSNGQHRFFALIKADVTLPLFIATGFKEDTFATIDNGRKRAVSDVLAHAGVLSAKNTASLCKFIFGFKQGRYGAHKDVSTRTLGNTSILSYYEGLDNVEINASVNFGQTYSKKANGIITPTFLGGMYYIFNELDREKSYEFLSKLSNGENLTDKSPILALRNKLIKAKTDKTYHLTPDTLVKTIVYCWEKFLKNESVKVIKLPEDYTINLQTSLPI